MGEPIDLREVAAFIQPFQLDPTTHVMYVGDDADSIAEDLADVVDLLDRLVVERDADGAITAVLAPDIDDELRKVWWFGPWASDPDVGWRLVEQTTAELAHLWDHEEFGPDTRNTGMIQRATERGCSPSATTIVLSCNDPGAVSGPSTTNPLVAELHAAVAALHDEAFPNTHTPGARLVKAEDKHVRTLTDDRGELLGYVAVEVHNDASGYVDYLGVVEARRGQGHGRALVADAVVELAARGVPRVHLTVSDHLTHARALYASLGFVEERRVVGMRRSTLPT